MTNTLSLYIVTFLYAGQGSICLHAGRFDQAAIMAGYVVANLGLIAAMRGSV